MNEPRTTEGWQWVSFAEGVYEPARFTGRQWWKASGGEFSLNKVIEWGEIIPPNGTRDKLNDIVECYDDSVRLDYIESYTKELLRDWAGVDDRTAVR